VLSAADVLATIGLEPAPLASAELLSGFAAEVLAVLADAPRGADELVRVLARGSADVAAALVELELAGVVDEADGVYRCRSP
jgi:predicted Rossmann fold nucleotide-binding protein DprA/Smf involved in DNA uptake